MPGEVESSEAHSTTKKRVYSILKPHMDTCCKTMSFGDKGELHAHFNLKGRKCFQQLKQSSYTLKVPAKTVEASWR